MEQELTPSGVYPSPYQAEGRSTFRPLAAADELRATASSLEEYLRPLVREQPVAAVFTAVGVGYILARVLARRMR